MTTYFYVALRIYSQLSALPPFKARIFHVAVVVNKIASTFLRSSAVTFLGAVCDEVTQQTVVGIAQAHAYRKAIRAHFKITPLSPVFSFSDRSFYSIRSITFVLPTSTKRKKVTAQRCAHVNCLTFLAGHT